MQTTDIPVFKDPCKQEAYTLNTATVLMKFVFHLLYQHKERDDS